MGAAGALVAEEQGLKCVAFLGGNYLGLALEQHIEAKLLRHDLGKKSTREVPLSISSFQ